MEIKHFNKYFLSAMKWIERQGNALFSHNLVESYQTLSAKFRENNVCFMFGGMYPLYLCTMVAAELFEYTTYQIWQLKSNYKYLLGPIIISFYGVMTKAFFNFMESFYDEFWNVSHSKFPIISNLFSSLGSLGVFGLVYLDFKDAINCFYHNLNNKDMGISKFLDIAALGIFSLLPIGLIIDFGNNMAVILRASYKTLTQINEVDNEIHEGKVIKSEITQHIPIPGIPEIIGTYLDNAIIGCHQEYPPDLRQRMITEKYVSVGSGIAI